MLYQFSFTERSEAVKEDQQRNSQRVVRVDRLSAITFADDLPNVLSHLHFLFGRWHGQVSKRFA